MALQDFSCRQYCGEFANDREFHAAHVYFARSLILRKSSPFRGRKMQMRIRFGKQCIRVHAECTHQPSTAPYHGTALRNF